MELCPLSQKKFPSTVSGSQTFGSLWITECNAEIIAGSGYSCHRIVKSSTYTLFKHSHKYMKGFKVDKEQSYAQWWDSNM